MIDLLAKYLGHDGQQMVLFLLGIAAGYTVIGSAMVAITRYRQARRNEPPPEAREVRRQAKRENERTKLTATFLNGTGIAVLLTRAIVPIFETFGDHPHPLPWAQTLTGAGVAFLLHASALWMMGNLRSEE